MKVEPKSFSAILGDEESAFIAMRNLESIAFLSEQISMIEKRVLKRVEASREYSVITTAPGIGKILGLTILLEVGDIKRFKKVGNFTSYCRCVKALKTSNEKCKGYNNRKNGNRYLGWAFVEAAHRCKAFCPQAQRFYDKKLSKVNGSLATKALAAKLTKAVYHMLTKMESFDVKKIFG
mgnify:FL=1